MFKLKVKRERIKGRKMIEVASFSSIQNATRITLRGFGQ